MSGSAFSFVIEVTNLGVELRLAARRSGLLDRLIRLSTVHSLESLPAQEQALAFALADLRALAEDDCGALRIEPARVFMAHDLVSRVDGDTAAALGLPPIVDLDFETAVDGMLGAPSFRLRYSWRRDGRPSATSRTGAILQTDRGLRRLPEFILHAIEIAEAFEAGEPLAEHWAALARFRRALEPEAAEDNRTAPDFAGRLRMTDFLSSLKVRVADALSVSPFETAGGIDFDPVPFAREALERRRDASGDIGEADAELSGGALETFQLDFRRSGAKPAYRVGDNAFLVIDRTAAPALTAMARAQRAPAGERTAFALNPQPAIVAAMRAQLEAEGRFKDLSDSEIEATVEAAVDPVLIETTEFAERVIGVGRWRPPSLPLAAAARSTWLPEDFDGKTRELIAALDLPALLVLKATVDAALEIERTEACAPVPLPNGGVITPSGAVSDTIAQRIAELEGAPGEGDKPGSAGADGRDEGPTVLKTAENFFDVAWRPERAPRASTVDWTQPERIATPLMEHQVDSLKWMIDTWRAGLPGVLNADEQGLGKTLQTIAFLAWLQDQVASDAAPDGPILVVAPTSLLQNWEAEVARHLIGQRLGKLVRLYGSALGDRRKPGLRGMDIHDGDARLDFNDVANACTLGRSGGIWMLTTYTALTNYQHSFAKLPFSVAVFDEIQALKNPASLRAAAARAMNADFRIGLTGTPIENRTTDLWAIMDQLAPGALGSLRAYAAAFGEPERDAMRILHERVFQGSDTLPALGLRRLKQQVAKDLPPKRRIMHPRLMPLAQAERYEAARHGMAQGGAGATLKLLHHIRTVSAHPGLDDAPGNDPDRFIADSARLSAVMDVLRMVRARGERALVFIEHQKLQHRFAALAKRIFSLDSVPIINGSTPVAQRMAIVTRFQRHLAHDEGFDLLVLGPRAAGVGLTLTAATHVIHLSRWWNPAVEEQCNDRVHRIGQTRPVTIHTPIAIHPKYTLGSFDCLLQDLMTRKRGLASAALWPMGDTEGDAAELERRMNEAEVNTSTASDPSGAATNFNLSGFADLDVAESIGEGAYFLRWVDGRGGGAVVLTAEATATSEAAMRALHAVRVAKPREDICAVVAIAPQGATAETLRDRSPAPVTALDANLAPVWPNYILSGIAAAEDSSRGHISQGR